ncbi:hypothetical protein [Pseudolactococcus insecticola]|uniref:Uncharacterized protein n=1 Tax=Pseudolactococcus insecticola TaxID=2709158 RepID=A0A6A0B774_9LACT|nr:hypothetical protein [Lactococcus insecticola]GFH40328.1 hypothetical protein Hs20B_07260 [Lactococcus insecticola]
MTNSIDYQVMKLVADAYMNNTTTCVLCGADLLGVTIKKDNSDLIYLFVNNHQTATVKVKGTRSHIISIDQQCLDNIKYIIPFAKSLGLPESTTLRCFEKVPEVI